MDGTECELIPPDFFLNLNYKEQSFCFGEIQCKLRVLDSAMTDVDLTGQTVWPASYTLAYYLAHHRDKLRDVDAIELGSGTGMVGIVAASCCRTVTVTDNQKIVLDLLSENVRHYAPPGSVCECKKLDWTSQVDREKFGRHQWDLVLGADVVYQLHDVVPLLDTVKYLLSYNPDARFVLAYKQRAANTEAFY